jgi:hypothetical protein
MLVQCRGWGAVKSLFAFQQRPWLTPLALEVMFLRSNIKYGAMTFSPLLSSASSPPLLCVFTNNDLFVQLITCRNHKQLLVIARLPG